MSAVIAGYNCASFVEPTIRSVLDQTYGKIEIIFVDDGSTDGTPGVVERFAPAVRLIAGGHGGVAEARNTGIRFAGGQYIAVLDHDDLWAPEKIERQIELMEAHSDVGIVFTRARVVGDPSQPPIIPPPRGDWEDLFAAGVATGDTVGTYVALLKENFVPLSSILLRRSAVPTEGFGRHLRFSEDHDFLLKISEHHRFGFIDDLLTIYTVRPGRATERMADMRLEDLAIFGENLARNPWLLRRDPGGMRRRHALLLREAGWWLLREGRRRQARPLLARAWAMRPLDPRLPAYLVASLRSGSGPARPAGGEPVPDQRED